MSDGFDWRALMHLGLHHLRLAPEVFWQLTPVELTIMAGGLPGAAPALTRARLEELCAEFPDRDKEK